MRRMAALLLLCAATSAQAQEKKKVVTLPYDGPDFFSHILFAKGLTPLASFEEAIQQPTKTLVIIWGAVNSRENGLIDVSHFLREQEKDYRINGGSLLVATDYPVGTPSFAVSGFPISMPLTDRVFGGQPPADRVFGGHSQCPWLTYGDKDTEERAVTREHPLFHLLNHKIATNHPSTLMAFETPTFQGLGRRFSRKGQPSYYLAASPKGTPPFGRTLIIAGHGIFINSMMLQPDTDNFAFAINAVEWLRQGPNATKRTQALFVVDGQIITKFDRDLTPPMPPIPMPSVEMVNRLLRGLEDEGFFHWLIERALGNRFRYAAPFLIGIATCLGLLYGAKKFMDNRLVNDTAVPRMVGISANTTTEVPRVRQRQKALYRQTETSDEARLLGRQWLTAELGVSAEQCTPGVVGIHVGGFFLTRRSLQKQADYVIELACAVEPTKISRADFIALVNSLTRLSRAHRAGRLTLLLNQKEVT
jgi:hypothetical protein